jgi:SAM-dependent methyltransferase
LAVDKPKSQSETVAGFWNDSHKNAEGGAHDNYLNHPLIQAYVSLRAFGSLTGHLDAAVEAVRTFSDPGDTIVSLGCGAALKERVLAAQLQDRHFVGIDIADQVIASVNETLQREGPANLTLRHGDFNQLDLPADSMQILLGLGAIHHVENLEGMWQQARHALSPGGVVLAQEYVGPNRFQWTAAQIQAGDHALEHIVPEEHKVHHRTIGRPALEFMIEMDPSEAVRSAEIVPTCRAAGFTIDSLTSAGGALLQPVLMHQIHTFDPANWSHNLVLSRLFEAEDRLMSEGVLVDDFAMLVARP